MAIKITRKQAEHLTANIYDISHILNVEGYLDKKYYNYGIYGWNFSIYQDKEGNYYIHYYRNIPKNVKKLDYDKTIKYKDKISELSHLSIDWDDRLIKIQEVLNDFIDEIKGAN